MKEFIEKLIGRLEGMYGVDPMYYGPEAKWAVDKAINIVNVTAKEHNNGWIPCSERLPEEGVDVLVWFEYFRYGNYNTLYQTTGISYTYNGKWSGFVNGESGWQQLSIIAWMPLPTPYKEGVTENE